jgi:hypothetical protein
MIVLQLFKSVYLWVFVFFWEKQRVNNSKEIKSMKEHISFTRRCDAIALLNLNPKIQLNCTLVYQDLKVQKVWNLTVEIKDVVLASPVQIILIASLIITRDDVEIDF